MPTKHAPSLAINAPGGRRYADYTRTHMIIEASTVLTPDFTHEPGWIEVTGTEITAVGSGRPPRAADYSLETLAPGFIDAHIHGGGGYSFNDPDPRAADHVADTHLQHGTTTMMASLVTR